MAIHKRIKKGAQYLLPSCITLIIYCIILSIKGIYPFGSNTIDYYDMAQQIAAFYYHVYDMLHGTKAFFYDWYSALGTNMAMSTSGCSNLSPFNLFFLFIERSSLLKSLSVFNGLKLMVMSFTMYFYLNKTHEKSPYFFKLAGAVGYSFCGFVLVLYITNQWVDIAALFPLIMYFYDSMMETGRIRGYVITLTVTLIVSYYLGFMILIFIFLYTGVRLAEKLLTGKARKTVSIMRNKDAASESAPDAQTDVPADGAVNGAAEENKESNGNISIRDTHLVQLGTGTFMSLALSAFILIPQLSQMLNSARFKNGNESEAGGLFGRYAEIISHVHGDYTTRWWSLLGISLAAAVILTGLIRFRRELRTVLMTVSMILLMVLELFFESINLIWHFGSYVQYPIRNGFIIYFVFANLMCYYAGRLYGTGDAVSDGCERGAKRSADPCVEGRTYLSFIITVIGFLAFVGFYRNHTGMPLRKVFHMTSAMMAVSFIYYFAVLNMEEIRRLTVRVNAKRGERKKQYEVNPEDECIAGSEEEPEGGHDTEEVLKESKTRLKYRWAAGVLVLELLCYGFLLFGKPDYITGYGEEPEQNGQYIYLCEQLREEFGLGNEFLYRVKNPDESLNANYGFVLMQPALSNWTHMIAPGEQEAAAAWGYSIQFTRLLDSGGTIFSDALIGVRRIISCVPMDERLYAEVNRAEIYAYPNSQETVTYYMYEPLYTLPFGAVLKDEDSLSAADNDIVDLHNSIYQSMINALPDQAEYDFSGSSIASWYVKDDKPVDDKVSSNINISASDKVVSSAIKIKGEAALYMLGSGGDKEYANCTIEVGSGSDMHYVSVPTIKYPDNIYYPAHFNNNAIYLGTYSDETVEVKITMDGDKGEYFDVDIMGVSIDELKPLCSRCLEAYQVDGEDRVEAYGNGLDISVKAVDGAGLMLPVTYDKGFNIRVNDKRAKGASYAGLFTIIPLMEGDNAVSMRFTPPGMKAGILITLVTLGLVLAYIIIRRINRESLAELIRNPESIAEPVLVKVYASAFTAVIVFMYIIPVLYGIYLLAIGR